MFDRLWGPARALGLFLALALCPAQARVPVPSGVAVLIYHHFISDADAARRASLLDEMTMSRAQFRRQLEFLKHERATVLTGAQFAAHVAGTWQAPRGSVLLVIDDGYESVYKIAWPLLKEYGMHAMVALIVGATEERDAWLTAHPKATPHLSWEQVHEIMEPVVVNGEKRTLISLASHTYRMHENLSRQESDIHGLARRAFHTRLLADLKRAREVIRARTADREHADFLVWPHGGYSTEMLEVARKAGHAGTFTDLGQVVRPGADPMNLTRVHAGSGSRARGALERNMRNAGWREGN